MERNSSKIILLIILCAGLFIPALSQDRKAELKKISRDADIILTGKVLKMNSLWNKDKTRIYTNVTVGVEEYLKGDNGSKNILIEYPGGEVGEVGEWYSHTPSFENDEEVLLFLKKGAQNDVYKVMNGEDGKLTLHTDKNTGEKMTSAQVGVSVLKKEIKYELK